FNRSKDFGHTPRAVARRKRFCSDAGYMALECCFMFTTPSHISRLAATVFCCVLATATALGATLDGVITTIAGNGTPGISGDGGPGPSAQVSRPQSVAVDAAG